MNLETQNLLSLSAVDIRKNPDKYLILNKRSEFKGGSKNAQQEKGDTQIRAQLTKVDDSNLNQTNTCNQTKNLYVTLKYSAKNASAVVTHDSTEPIYRSGQNGILIPRRKNSGSYPMVLKHNHEDIDEVCVGYLVPQRVSHNSDVTETDDDDDSITISKEVNTAHEFDIDPTLYINKNQPSVSSCRSCPTIISDRNSHERIKGTRRQIKTDITNTKVLQEFFHASMEHIEKEGCFKQPPEMFRQHVLYPEKKEYRMPPLTPVPIYPNDRNEQTNINPFSSLLYSYRQCPNDLQVSPSELARAGFHSISTDNQRVGCRSCGIELNINDFNGNDPYIVHRQMSSTCPALYRERDPSTILKQETTPSWNVNETETDYSDLQRSELVTPNDNLPNANGTPQNDTINERNTPSDERNSIQIDSVQGATASFVSSASSASPATPTCSASAASHPLINYPPRNPSHKSSESRQQSFRNWPGAAQDIDALEQAGFFFTGEDDIVRCFHCDIGLAEWDPSDDPWVEHARHSPDCPFLRSQRDEHFISNIQKRWAQIYTPKHPHRTQMSTRLESFHPSWPRDFVVQTPEQLAGAGFFYTGETDTVRCHYCDGGLRDWEPNDDPWTEHARWFPFCKFVIKVKGLSFIETAALTEDNDSELDNNTAVTPTPTRAHTMVASDGYWPCEGGEYRENENMTNKETASDDKPIAVYNCCAYNVGTPHRDLTVIPEAYTMVAHDGCWSWREGGEYREHENMTPKVLRASMKHSVFDGAPSKWTSDDQSVFYGTCLLQKYKIPLNEICIHTKGETNSNRHGDCRFPRGEKRYIEASENTTEGIVKKTKSQNKLRVYARKRLAINTKKVTKDKSNKIGQRSIDGCGIHVPMGSNVKRECSYEEHSCPQLEIKTQKEIFRQSMEYFPQSNKQSKEILKFVSEWNTELMSQTSNMYMLHSNHLQNQLTGGTDVTSRQYEHSGDYNTVNPPLPPPSNEETMTNDTIGDGNEVVATSEEQRTHDLQAERTPNENHELQQSNNNEDGNRANEVCQSAYPVRNPAFADEPTRIETYMYWGKGDPSKHSEAGFFFTGNDDIVRCFHCDIGIGGWNLTSDPWTEHARYSPACPFLRTEKSQNWIDSIQANWKQTYKPKHPDYQQMDARQKSFEHAGWRQMDCSLSRKRLAEAGCFFEGDHIRCHYCGGNLREDGSTEEPWIIHAKIFPFCKFVQMSKGDDFIETHINDQTELELPGHYLPVTAGLEGHIFQLCCVTEFDIRAERDPMATAAAQCLLEMGYDRNTITEAIKTFISRTGRRDIGAKEMIDIIQEYEEALFENKQLRSRLLCKSCCERDWINIFVPCGHLVCQQCSAGLAICAICQNAISETVKVYF